jgi:hypothetical protein
MPDRSGEKVRDPKDICCVFPVNQGCEGDVREIYDRKQTQGVVEGLATGLSMHGRVERVQAKNKAIHREGCNAFGNRAIGA